MLHVGVGVDVLGVHGQCSHAGHAVPIQRPSKTAALATYGATSASDTEAKELPEGAYPHDCDISPTV